VGESWRMPEAYVRDNAAMTFHLLDAVREEAPGAAVVVAASSELYGPPAELPVDESAPLRPQNPYAVSKAGADLLAGFFADAHGLRVFRARPFNHAGPGQEPIYAIASFTRQVAAGIVARDATVRVVTGDPDALRDYTDVHDATRAYRELAGAAEPGVYNICSGHPASAAELLAALGRVTRVEIDHVVDDSLRRANEVMEIRGSYDRLHTATGWEPQIPLEQTLADTVEWWTEEIRAGRAPDRLHE
jgi:GDP-4-dehydro-6-deoxy-D-mannose reductase